MKKMMLSLLCAVVAFPLVSVEPETENPAAIEKKITQLEKNREQVQKTLIDRRRKEIIKDQYALGLANKILTLNQELSEFLNTKPEINKLNRDLLNIEKEISRLKAAQKKDSKKAGK